MTNLEFINAYGGPLCTSCSHPCFTVCPNCRSLVHPECGGCCLNLSLKINIIKKNDIECNESDIAEDNQQSNEFVNTVNLKDFVETGEEQTANNSNRITGSKKLTIDSKTFQDAADNKPKSSKINRQEENRETITAQKKYLKLNFNQTAEYIESFFEKSRSKEIRDANEKIAGFEIENGKPFNLFLRREKEKAMSYKAFIKKYKLLEQALIDKKEALLKEAVSIISKCPICELNYQPDDNDIEMLQCESCDKWVHRECTDKTKEDYKQLVKAENPEPFFCIRCIFGFCDICQFGKCPESVIAKSDISETLKNSGELKNYLDLQHFKLENRYRLFFTDTNPNFTCHLWCIPPNMTFLPLQSFPEDIKHTNKIKYYPQNQIIKALETTSKSKSAPLKKRILPGILSDTTLKYVEPRNKTAINFHLKSIAFANEQFDDFSDCISEVVENNVMIKKENFAVMNFFQRRKELEINSEKYLRYLKSQRETAASKTQEKVRFYDTNEKKISYDPEEDSLDENWNILCEKYLNLSKEEIQREEQLFLRSLKNEKVCDIVRDYSFLDEIYTDSPSKFAITEFNQTISTFKTLKRSFNTFLFSNSSLISFFKKDYYEIKNGQFYKNDEKMERPNSEFITTKLRTEVFSKNLSGNLNDKFTIKCSPIEGFGVFSTGTYQKNELITVYDGVRVSIKESNMMEKFYDNNNFKDKVYMFTYKNGQDLFVEDATIIGTYAKFMNHSCDPNCHSEEIFFSDFVGIGIYADRFIEEGEELTYKYGIGGEEKLICKCGTDNCQGFL